MPGINLINVSWRYPNSDLILSKINLQIKPGEFVGLTGINGSGKSTLLYLLNGLIPKSIPGHLTGTIDVDGHPNPQKVGLVFQNPDFSLFNLTVEEELMFGLSNFHLDNIKTRVKTALAQVGMQKFINRDPQTLSFGQKQLISLACVLALDPPYLALDEPSAMLDYKNSLNLYQILLKLNQQGKTIITVEHDTDFLAQFTQKIIILDQGKIIASGSSKKILARRSLLQSLGIKTPAL